MTDAPTADRSPAAPRSTSLLTPAEVARGQALLGRITGGLERVILGQRDLVELSVIALAARGHLLLEGLPGLGKTELVKTLSKLLGLRFKRVQFTPDLLPPDITGGPSLPRALLNTGRRTGFAAVPARCRRSVRPPCRTWPPILSWTPEHARRFARLTPALATG